MSSPKPPTARSPNGWPATTCSPSACATTPAGCSARSRSTTCSTASSAGVAPAPRWHRRNGRTGVTAIKRREDLTPPASPPPRRPLRPRGVRPLQRVDRPLPRHRPLPRLPDGASSSSGSPTTSSPRTVQFDPWDRGSSCSPWCSRCRRLRGAADPAGPEPPGGPRPHPVRERPEVAERTQADTEFLAREIASVRLMLADVVTGEELREQLAGTRPRRSTAAVQAPDARASRRQMRLA